MDERQLLSTIRFIVDKWDPEQKHVAAKCLLGMVGLLRRVDFKEEGWDGCTLEDDDKEVRKDMAWLQYLLLLQVRSNEVDRHVKQRNRSAVEAVADVPEAAQGKDSPFYK